MADLATPRPVLSRRSALALGGAFALASAGGTAAFAATPGERKFVLVILRGALDGLSAVSPYGDPNYRAVRTRLALDPPGGPNGTLPLTDGFGLHPRLAFLQEAWAGRELAILHAAASPYRDRSHFDGQDVLESGGAEVFALSDGWLNRAIAALPPGPGREGVAIASTIPLALRGSAPATSWAPSAAPAAEADTLARLMDLYAGDTLLGPNLARAIETSAIAQDAGMSAMDPGQGRRAAAGAYRGLAEAAARLISAPNGPAAAVLAFDGWDTHANQGGANLQGALAPRLAGLDAALRALKTGLSAHWSKTVVVVATEFGRTVAENGTGGTDHGTGGVAFILGGGVNGGRMIGDWPGLARTALFQGRDLAPANDLRGLFMTVLGEHWGIDRAALTGRVFPGAAGVRRFDGLVRA